MPYAIDSTSATFVDVRIWGTLTRAEFDDAAVVMRTVLQPWTRVLFDAAELENAAEVFTMFVQAPWRAELPSDIRQAAVIGPRAAAVARSWIRQASAGSAGTQAFTTRDAAVEWLLREYQTTTGGS